MQNDAATLSEQEAQGLSDAFNFLFHGLRQAKARFESPGAQDGGRAGAIDALETVMKFFEVLKKTDLYPWIIREAVHAPLARLLSDLIALDEGNASSPMLAPKKRPRGGRAIAPATYDALKAFSLFTVKRLEDTGLDLVEARKQVACRLRNAGVRPARGNGQITERTLRDWQDDASYNQTTTETLKLLNKNPSQPAGDDPRREYLDMLDRFIVSTRAQEKPLNPPS